MKLGDWSDERELGSLWNTTAATQLESSQTKTLSGSTLLDDVACVLNKGKKCDRLQQRERTNHRRWHKARSITNSAKLQRQVPRQHGWSLPRVTLEEQGRNG